MATQNSVNNQLGPSSSLVISSNGAMTLPQQPCFGAYLSSNATAVTGNGATYTLIADTELFDKSNSYNHETGVFTAPITGIYQFDVFVTLTTGSISIADAFQIILSTTQNNFAAVNLNPSACAGATLGVTQGFSIKVPMTISNTASVNIMVDGLVSNTVSVAGGAVATYFSGALIN